MEEQNRSRASYLYHSEDRRQNALPSISSHLHYGTSGNTIHDASNTRQSPSETSNYAQPGTLAHAAYDPVHDAYGIPRAPTSQTSGLTSAYTTETYHRGDRGSLHPYSTTRRFEDMTLAPIQQHGHHGHAQPSSIQVGEMQSFRSATRPHSPGDNFHSFQVPAQAHSGSSSSSIIPRGGTYPAHAEGGSSVYPTLPPLSLPTQVPSSSGEGKSAPKRIVMACHQCRGRKIRCDAGRPACSNCVRRREECRYDAKPKRRGPDKIPGSRMRSCKSRKQASEETS